MSAHFVWLDLDLLCRRLLRIQVTSKIINGPKSNDTNGSDVHLANTMGDALRASPTILPKTHLLLLYLGSHLF